MELSSPRSQHLQSSEDPAASSCKSHLTLRFQVFAELRLGLSVGAEPSLLRELVGHGGRCHHRLEAPLALGDVLLRVEEDDVHLGHVEHAQGHRGTQTHRDGERRGLDVHLQDTRPPAEIPPSPCGIRKGKEETGK